MKEVLEKSSPFIPPMTSTQGVVEPPKNTKLTQAEKDEL